MKIGGISRRERNGKKDVSRHSRNEKYDIRSKLTATQQRTGTVNLNGGELRISNRNMQRKKDLDRKARAPERQRTTPNSQPCV